MILAVGFTVTCTLTFFLGMLIGQGIEERKLLKREGQGPVAKIPIRPSRRGSSPARATPQDQEMTFYDTLTKTPPRAKARPERKAQVSQPKKQAAKQAAASTVNATDAARLALANQVSAASGAPASSAMTPATA